MTFRRSLNDDTPLNDYAYRLRESGEVVVVRMTLEDKFDREQHGFLQLPGGLEARYSAIEQSIYDTGLPPEQAEKVRLRPKWPMRTSLLGFNPDQFDDIDHMIRERGLRGVEPHEDGTFTIHSRRARTELCEAMGLFDRNGGYGDPQARNR